MPKKKNSAPGIDMDLLKKCISSELESTEKCTKSDKCSYCEAGISIRESPELLATMAKRMVEDPLGAYVDFVILGFVLGRRYESTKMLEDTLAK